MSKEIIEIIANLALALSFIIGLIFGLIQIKALGRDRKERLTLETLRNYQSHTFAELMFKINAAKIPKTFEEWRKLPDNDQILFLQFAQDMESLGILVAERYINMELVDKTLGSFVISSWNKFKTVILDIREKQPDPFLCEYYQWLAERLNERMKRCPRKPFHLTKQ
jgi:hypothetical protein